MIKEKHKHMNMILEKAFLIRKVEEKLLDLFKQGKINGTVHTCIGQELIPVCIAEYLNDDDYVFSNHRGHGHLLSRTNDIEGFFAELMGKNNGICGGMGGSQHLYKSNHLSNGIQGGMTPIASGVALANKINNNNKIVVCFIGDGTLGQGIVYETFNIASIWNLPVIYVLENNKVAQSTDSKQTLAGSVKKRIEGFGLKYLKTNVWSIEHMLEVFEDATNHARKNQKPVFIEVEAYRLMSHSKGDDNRNPEEINKFRLKDLLTKEIETNNEFVANLLPKISKIIDTAIINVEKFSDFTNIDIKECKENEITYEDDNKTVNNKRINELIHDALKEQFVDNNKTIMIGEDIEYLSISAFSPYGGAFKVSGDLSEHFANIRNTPISEAALIGIGTGLAIGGMKPIVEIMFGDFMTLTFDQLFNHACKFNKMYNNKLSIPLVVRTPMGGKRGYGPTHSQSIEKHFLGIPDLLIIVLNHRISPLTSYRAIFSENKPTLVIENKVLYTIKLNTKSPIGYTIHKSNEKHPTLRITPAENKPDVTILCYGEMLVEVEKAVEIAFEEEEILCEIICPTMINPININPITNSVKKTMCLLTVEEGSNVAAFSSEVSALLSERGVFLKSFKRISNNFVIPSSYMAEKTTLPNANLIFSKIKEIYYEK